MRPLTFSKGGIHVPENKFTPVHGIVDVELPRRVTLMLKQHIGMPAVPIVKKGDKVVRYQKVAEAQGRVSAPVHTPISGTVEKIALALNTAGAMEEAIFIVADEDEHLRDSASLRSHPTAYDYKNLTPEDIIGAIADAGVVGLGGATFPTAMKLSPPPGSKVDMIILNGAECEPYLTCDHALMLAHPEQIVEGLQIMIKATKAKRAVIAIEDNKKDAFVAMTQAAKGSDSIKVVLLKTKYPQGGEKQLIKAVCGVEVPSGALPVNVGVVIQNVATAYAVYCAVALRQPLVEKVVTIAGSCNFRVPIGMNISDIPVNVNEIMQEADVVIGGPMMGRSAATLDAPFQKGISGVTVIKPLKYAPQPCLRCGECVQACPMGLEPYLVSTYGRLRRVDDAVAFGALDCIECGSCNYSCPSARPILDYIRLAKTAYRNRPKK